MHDFSWIRHFVREETLSEVAYKQIKRTKNKQFFKKRMKTVSSNIQIMLSITVQIAINVLLAWQRVSLSINKMNGLV